MKLLAFLLIFFISICICIAQTEDLFNEEDSFLRKHHQYHHDDASSAPVQHYSPPPAPAPAPVSHSSQSSPAPSYTPPPAPVVHHHKMVAQIDESHHDESIQEKDEVRAVKHQDMLVDPHPSETKEQIHPYQQQIVHNDHESIRKQEEKQAIEHAGMIVGPEKKKVLTHHKNNDELDQNDLKKDKVIGDDQTYVKSENPTGIKHKIESLKHSSTNEISKLTKNQPNTIEQQPIEPKHHIHHQSENQEPKTQIQDPEQQDKKTQVENPIVKPNSGNDNSSPDDSLKQVLNKGEKGVDVSHYQAQINWPIVKKQDNINFAFIKATQGTSSVDPDFKENWENAGKVGIQRGAYCFFDPNEDPIQQAKFFLKTAPKGELPPVLDLEQTGSVPPSVAANRALEWLQYVKQKTQQNPILYTYPDFSPSILKNKEFAQYPLWISDPNNSAKPALPPVWNGHYSVWQYGQKKEPGFQVPVDEDVVH